ncbi:GNAT family N-acetyltransferase [Roseobacter sp. HKCCD7870]|uniref:GNAT family N-acetyltransferase n=1 Tax=Roseobacter sp. HKCCD7870 TaxID=3120343 RepID=UPI0030EB3B07
MGVTIQDLSKYVPPARPEFQQRQGRYARLERLRAHLHADELFRAYDSAEDLWQFLPYGPFISAAAYDRFLRGFEAGEDPVFYAIRDMARGQVMGVASYLRIAPEKGSIELGHICLGPALQKSPAATEAFFMMMSWAFEAGYRRFEWKCDARNLPSRRAAQRLGLSYEGVFRQDNIVKGKNRDTAWFAAIDAEYPALKEAFTEWLLPQNFDATGRQIERLSDLTGLVRVARDPTLGS